MLIEIVNSFTSEKPLQLSKIQNRQNLPCVLKIGHTPAFQDLKVLDHTIALTVRRSSKVHQVKTTHKEWFWVFPGEKNLTTPASCALAYSVCSWDIASKCQKMSDNELAKLVSLPRNHFGCIFTAKVQSSPGTFLHSRTALPDEKRCKPPALLPHVAVTWSGKEYMSDWLYKAALCWLD